MRFPKIKVQRIKEFLKRLLLVLGEKAFLTFLGLLLIALIFGAIIYYQYSALTKRAEVQVVEELLQFQEKAYQNVLKIWQEREKKFEEAGLKEHPDLFRIDQLEEPVPEESSGSSGVDQEENFR